MNPSDVAQIMFALAVGASIFVTNLTIFALRRRIEVLEDRK